MAEKLITLSENDVKVLKELVTNDRERLRNTQGRTLLDQEEQGRRSFIAKSPVGGIAARVGAVVSTADCSIYQRTSDGLVDTGFDKPVYNLLDSVIAGNTYFAVEQDPWGTWWALPTSAGGSGITSLNDDTTAAQTLGLGSAGTDINIATAGVPYDNTKTYSRGWIVTSAGSTYRYINATPSAGNAPPNATYWVDVTGDGLNVVNVPDWSTANRGLFTATGNQTGRGIKTVENNNSGIVGQWKATTTASVDHFSYLDFTGIYSSGASGTLIGVYTASGVGLFTTAHILPLSVTYDVQYRMQFDTTSPFFRIETQDLVGGAIQPFFAMTLNIDSNGTNLASYTLMIASSWTGVPAAWNSGTAYVIGNLVTYGDLEYVCIANNTNVIPTSGPTYYWHPYGRKPRFAVLVGSVAGNDVRYGVYGTALYGATVNGGIVTALGSAVTKTDVGLGNVENTALSTWAGSTNIVTVGTITTGTWNGTAIADAYIASAATWNTALQPGDMIPATDGGTGIDTSALTGIPFITAGVWSTFDIPVPIGKGGTGSNLAATGPGIVVQASNGANLTIDQEADIGALTDSTGGTANTTLVDVTTAGLADPAKCNDNFADLTAQVNALRTTLRSLGAMA